MAKAIVVYVTCPNITSARRISQALLKAKLAACTNILPQMESHYRWRGKLEKSKEVVLLIKSTAKRYTALEKKVKSLHPYEVPCIWAIKPSKIASEYLSWITQEVP